MTAAPPWEQVVAIGHIAWTIGVVEKPADQSTLVAALAAAKIDNNIMEVVRQRALKHLAAGGDLRAESFVRDLLLIFGPLENPDTP